MMMPNGVPQQNWGMGPPRGGWQPGMQVPGGGGGGGGPPRGDSGAAQAPGGGEHRPA